MKKKLKNGNGDDEADRFSTLPVELRHRILSRFEIWDLASFCCVSSTCKELALSAPIVRIHASCVMSCEYRLSLANAVDRFFLRRRDRKIRKFSLNWRGHYTFSDSPPCLCVKESFRMFTWILNALRCNVEKISVDMIFYNLDDGELLLFPSCVFKCTSLRSLTVAIPSTLLQTPSLSVHSNLETLRLTNVEIADEGFFRWITSSCKLLKRLFLSTLKGINTITIESSSLTEIFYVYREMSKASYLNIYGENIEKIHIDCRYSLESTVVNIIAPKVKFLVVEGNVKNNWNIGGLDCLQEAYIRMEPIVDDFDKAYEVLSKLCSVKVLALNEPLIKAAYREGRVHAQLNKTLGLQIEIESFVDDLVPAVVSLLRATPNLLGLNVCDKKYIRGVRTSLAYMSDTYGFNKEYWKKQNLDFISQVTGVTIELTAGSNGIEFARYVLENGTKLKEMVIRGLPHDSSVKMKLSESCIITNAAVTFV